MFHDILMFNFSKFNQKAKGIEEWLAKELGSVRTSRATPAILDGVLVESYGVRLPINQVGSIASQDARTLFITPWDASSIKEIEKAIVAANLGLSVSAVDTGVRVSFPELTSERRQALIKVAKEKLEDARVSVRKIRDEIQNEIAAAEKAGGMGEDEKFRLKAELQKLTDALNKKLQESAERKEREITS
ncbi:MAG: ribosome recycling factor [Candidatus Taylorbacteria bacterium]|nr:ribosome recycling factor [Candidatus Taylorbacteria bacterium]